MNWEQIEVGENAPAVLRFAVPGGWLYRVERYGGSDAQVVFVPDTQREQAPSTCISGYSPDPRGPITWCVYANKHAGPHRNLAGVEWQTAPPYSEKT